MSREPNWAVIIDFFISVKDVGERSSERDATTSNGSMSIEDTCRRKEILASSETITKKLWLA